MSALPDAVVDVASILALDAIDDPLSLDWPRRFIARELGWIPTFDLDRTDPHGLYGGHVIAQTVWSACQTVPAGFDVHSTHGYFLRPGNSQERIVYHVYEVRTGRGYATRRIEAMQFDKVIYTSFANFKHGFAAQTRAEDVGIRHGVPYPTETWYPRYNDIPSLPSCPDVDLPALRDFQSFWEMPITYRKVPLDTLNAAVSQVHERRQVHFFQSRYEVADKSHNFQAVVLMYASDRNFLFTATNAHFATTDLSFAHVASLDHAMVIHTSLGTSSANQLAQPLTSSSAVPTRSTESEWITYDTRSPAAGNSRCLVTGHMWDKEGAHLATVMQEALADVTVLGPHEATQKGASSKL